VGQSNGEPIVLWPDGKQRLLGPIKGDVIRIHEWYGWSGMPNEGKR
jgi:hypothetical protein